MSNEINHNPYATPEVETPEVETPEVETPEIETLEVETPEVNSPGKDDNLRIMRENQKRDQERAETAEKERDEMAKYIENLRYQQNQQSNARQPLEIERTFGLTGDDFVEPKHLNAVMENQKRQQAEMNEWRLQQEETTAEMRLVSEYKDFNNVVTEVNIKNFIKEHPEMRSTFVNNDPIYSKAKAAYKVLKKFSTSESKEAKYEKEYEKIQNNNNKPRPTSSVGAQQGSTPLSKANLFANGYNEEVAAFLQKEMKDAINNG